MIRTKPAPVTPSQSSVTLSRQDVMQSRLLTKIRAAARQRRHREKLRAANAAKTLAETVAADG